jgi:CRP-like cAMP-binding protein
MKNLKCLGIIDLVNEKSFCSYAKGDIIFEQGKRIDFILYIETGKAKIVRKNSKGQEFTFLHVKKGDYLGVHPLLNGENSFVSVIATEPLSGYKISEADLSKVIENKREVALDLIKHLCSKIGLIESKISKISPKKIKENVAEALLLNKIKSDQANSYSIQDIANMVGTTRNYIYKILKELVLLHALEIKNKKVKVIDKTKLAKLVNQ